MAKEKFVKCKNSNCDRKLFPLEKKDKGFCKRYATYHRNLVGNYFGYCFQCCTEEAPKLEKKFKEKLAEKYPELAEEYDEISKAQQRRNSAFIID